MPKQPVPITDFTRFTKNYNINRSTRTHLGIRQFPSLYGNWGLNDDFFCLKGRRLDCNGSHRYFYRLFIVCNPRLGVLAINNLLVRVLHARYFQKREKSTGHTEKGNWRFVIPRLSPSCRAKPQFPTNTIFAPNEGNRESDPASHTTLSREVV